MTISSIRTGVVKKTLVEWDNRQFEKAQNDKRDNSDQDPM